MQNFGHKGRLEDAVCRALKMVEGTYGIAVICAHQLARLHAQLLKLTVKMSAFEPGSFRDARHAAAFAHQMMFEIRAFKSISRFAQR